MTQPFPFWTALGADAVGGIFAQAYLPTIHPTRGDLSGCDFVGNVDQFDTPRTCLQGAVEKDVFPFAPLDIDPRGGPMP